MRKTEHDTDCPFLGSEAPRVHKIDSKVRRNRGAISVDRSGADTGIDVCAGVPDRGGRLAMRRVLVALLLFRVALEVVKPARPKR